MATQASNPYRVSILESVAPRLAPDPDPSMPSASRFGSVWKATGALGAPVAGLIALAAIGAAGAGVGAGLGSLPGKPGLSGAAGQRPLRASNAIGSPGALSAPAPGITEGRAGIPPSALGSLAAPLTRRALAGVGITSGRPAVTDHGSTRGGTRSLGSTHGSTTVRATQPSSQAPWHRTSQSPSGPSDPTTSSGQPGSGASQPSATQSPNTTASATGQPAPNQSGGGQAPGSTTGSGGSSTSRSSQSSTGQTTSSGQTTTDGQTTTSSSPQTTTGSDATPNHAGGAAPASRGDHADGRASAPTTTTSPSDS